MDALFRPVGERGSLGRVSFGVSIPGESVAHEPKLRAALDRGYMVGEKTYSERPADDVRRRGEDYLAIESLDTSTLLAESSFVIV